MSLLTAEDKIPSQDQWNKATIKELRKGDQFFTPFTSFKAVYDDSGINLETRFKNLQDIVNNQGKTLLEINAVSKNEFINSLGDVKLFLQGFKNGDNLHITLDNINQEMLRFEKTGQIE